MALLLDGVLQRALIRNYTIPTVFTISCWIRKDSAGIQRPWGANGDFEIRTSGGDPFNYIIDIYGSAGGGGSIDVAVGDWTHVLVTGDSGSGDTQMFINGVLDVSNNQGGGSPSEELSIGSTNGNIAEFLEGAFADFRVYNRVVSAEEAETIYAARGHDDIVDGLEVRYIFKEEPETEIVGPFKDQEITNATSTGSLNITTPTNEDGDLLIAVIGDGGSGGTPPIITAPADWTIGNAGNTGLPSTGTTPAVYFFYRTASSEPASYTFTSNIAGTPMIGTIISYDQNQIGSQVPQIVPSILNTGTSASPTSPSITLDDISLVLRVCCTDDDELPVIPEAFCPAEGTCRLAEDNGGGTGNGLTLSVVEEMLPSGATGTAVFNPAASEQWGCLTIGFNSPQIALFDLSGNGNVGSPENDPVHDVDPLSLRKRKR